MVFKVSKGGVRSGNTLRGLQSRRTKLYGRNSCLLGSSNLALRDLHNLLSKSSEGDRLVEDTLKRTDVLLSLNKKQRWQIPAMINQMISHGSFDGRTKVSLLERHKLKRRSNCVRFASNKGRLTAIQPRQKNYFSFSLDSVGNEQSNREKRRVCAEELKKMGTSEEKNMKKKRSVIKTVETFTRGGTKSSSSSFAIEQSTKPEYRLEVFYPCPQSCSLMFNPKYTDVKIEEGDGGKLEVKANAKAPKNGHRRQRRRFTSKDLEIEAFGDENIEQDINEMWEDTETDTDKMMENNHESYERNNQLQESFLEILIGEAVKAHSFLVTGKKTLKKKHFDQPKSDVKKGHIVYMEPEKEELIVQNSPPAIDSSHYLQDVKLLDFVKVVLKSSETSTESLQKKYGAMYSEADCQPRRFIIDISDDVVNLLSRSKTSSKSVLFMSYLVFTYDGIYDDGLEVFRVTFNSCLCKNTANLSEYLGFSQTSLDDVLNSLIGYLLDLQDTKELKSDDFYRLTDETEMKSFLSDRLNFKMKTFNPSHAFSDKTVCEWLEEEGCIGPVSQEKYIPKYDNEDTFCDICYDTINPAKIDAAQGTQLSLCGHLCCDNCWASHVHSQIREGSTTLTCPGYNCSTELGLVTLLSIVNVSDVALLFQRKAEKEVEETENTKWCPNATCGRAIQIQSKTNDLCQDVRCPCGTEMCFTCLGSAHWPAKCYQAEEYSEKLNKLKPPKETVEEEHDARPIGTQHLKPEKEEIFEVEGRICPRCGKFIEKNGGCQRIKCKCGFDFCWDCMKSFHGYGQCKYDHDYLYMHTRLLRIHHRQRQHISENSPSPNRKPKKIDNAKQRVTLYKHALQQRLEISKAPSPGSCKVQNNFVRSLVSAAQKDVQFKQQIMTTMEVQAVPEDLGELRKLDIRPIILRLIISSKEIKAVLHRVVQFSYVLLQDTSNSTEKQRILRLANDIAGICSFFTSILELGDRQNVKTAFHRLMSVQEWAKRALDDLIVATRKLRKE